MPNLNKDMPYLFPEQLNRHAVPVFQIIAKTFAFLKYKIHLDISQSDLTKLQDLKKSRTILLPNHPIPHDWLTLFLLSAKLNDPFYYMTAHEQFRGLKRWLIPSMGAYSVRRGGWGDKGSAAQTLSIMNKPDFRLVIFPEGQCSFSSNRILPFKKGAVRLGLKSLANRKLKGDKNHTHNLVPLFIHYQHTEPVDEKLDHDIGRLEKRLALRSKGTVEDRLQYLVYRIIDLLEDEHNVSSSHKIGLTSRIETLIATILNKLERQLGIIKAPRQGTMNRACNIRQVLATAGCQHNITRKHHYELTYQQTLVVLILDSLLNINFKINLTTNERVDILWSLERIVYEIPDPEPKGWRQATVRVADIIHLEEWESQHSGHKRQIENEITSRLEHSITKALNNLYSYPIHSPDRTTPYQGYHKSGRQSDSESPQ